MDWAHRPLRKENREFFDAVKLRTQIDIPDIDDKKREKMEGRIARNMTKVAKYARRMDVPVDAESILLIRVQDHFELEDDSPLKKKDPLAFYEDGVINFEKRSWNNRHYIAHEMFHHIQLQNGNNLYSTHAQQAYVEGGADFFAAAYSGRFASNVIPMILVHEKPGRRTEFNMEFKKYKKMGKDKRAKFLLSLFKPRSRPDNLNEYKDGDRFAMMALAINRNRVKKTINAFAYLNSTEAVSRLSEKNLTIGEKMQRGLDALSGHSPSACIHNALRKFRS